MHACMQSEVYLSGPRYTEKEYLRRNNMTPRTKGRFILLPMLLCVCLTLCSCGSNESAEKPSAASSDTVAKDSSPATTAAAGSRDNTPVVLTGSADGTVTYGNDSVTVDASIRKKAILWFPTPVPTPKSNCRSQVLMRSLTHIIYMMVMKPFPSLPEAVPTPSAVFENIEGTSYSTLFTQAIV